MSKRNLFRLVVLILAVAWFGYGYFKNHKDTNADQASPVAVAAVIPANAKSFVLGTLQFKACELAQKKSGATTAAFCTPFQVPENPDAAADGRKIGLRLALVKSNAEAADTDIVVFLAGGPGQSAVDTYPQIAGALEPLRKHHHILLLDQRGTGGSAPLTCERAKDEADEDEFNLAQVTRQAKECLAQVEKIADPRMYTTTIATHDLEAVRQALGAPQFDLVGVSYGTRMAQQYLMRYPAGVRSVVLDSVAPNELIFGDEFAGNLEAALKAQFARCTQTPACAKAFGDSYANLIKLRDQLQGKPQIYSYRDPITNVQASKHLNGYTLIGLVRMFAYGPESAALLPLSIAEGLKGNYAPLAGQSQLLTGDLSDLKDNGMQMSVVCSEDADLLKGSAEDADTVLGMAMVQALRAQCAVWPHGARPADFHTAISSDKPVFVLEGELDPVTPPRYGEQVMKGLSNARLLIARGQGHNVIARGCIPKLVGDFVDLRNPKKLDVSCADMLGATPAFIDFNGPSP